MLPRRAYALVDIDAILANVGAVKQKVGPDVKTMAIVKTDAYGHGAVRISKELSAAGIDAFGVATVEEGALLRRNSIKEPILILGYVFPEDYEELLNNSLMHAVFSYENACALSKKAGEMNKTAKIHIKIDTGMGRIGFLPDENSLDEIVKISKLPNIEINGIFTHFACADTKDKTSCNNQKKLYLDFLKKLENKGIEIPVKHMDNSAGIIDYNSDFLDMVRIGIMTYGMYPSDEVDKDSFRLIPALSLLSSVSMVKSVQKGFTVSYGSTFTAPADMDIATVSIGYGDGYPRALSNKGRVLIGGEYCNIIGRVCMDQLMVDVTGKNVSQGDRVTLVGTDGGNTITAEEVSALAGSFNYEFCCNINMRVPRVYVKGGKVIEINDYLAKM